MKDTKHTINFIITMLQVALGLTWDKYSDKNPDARWQYCIEMVGPPRMIIDAGEESCNAHPQHRCAGRLINHLETPHANLTPKDTTLNKLETPVRVVLFKANRPIRPLEQLFFDYHDKSCKDAFGK